MRLAWTIGAMLPALTVIVSGSLAAGPSEGQWEFEHRCASCHGLGGKGDGWMAKYLSHRPPALTQIKKRNGGSFPYDDVYQIIDGRKAIELHGPREMPVWGTVIPTEAERKIFGPAALDEKTARLRIRAMVEYLSNIQE